MNYTAIERKKIFLIQNFIPEIPRKDAWNPGGKLNPGFPESTDKPGSCGAPDPNAFCSVCCSKTALGKTA